MDYCCLRKENGWAYLLLTKDFKDKNHAIKPRKVICVLPNGKDYDAYDLYSNQNTKYKKLFEQFSGEYPSFTQIEQVKEKYKKQGWQ